jgi:lipoyl(octanoyl) transferase
MHGLALNVESQMEHFKTIVPCGLAGYGVTSMRCLLGDGSPRMDEVKGALVGSMRGRLGVLRGGAFSGSS